MINIDFSDKDNIPDKIWWALCDAGLSMPVPLIEADLSQPFVYYRKYGIFYVPPQKHPFALAFLLALEEGVTNYLNIDHTKLGISDFRKIDVYSYSDYFLENYVGTCYMSSVNNKIRVGKKGNLNEREIDFFDLIEYSK